MSDIDGLTREDVGEFLVARDEVPAGRWLTAAQVGATLHSTSAFIA
jgi:hypothetical protein